MQRSLPACVGSLGWYGPSPVLAVPHSGARIMVNPLHNHFRYPAGSCFVVFYLIQLSNSSSIRPPVSSGILVNPVLLGVGHALAPPGTSMLTYS